MGSGQSPGQGRLLCMGECMCSPPRMCSSANVSPKRSGGAATVPLSSRHSFARKDSLKVRPFSFSLQASRKCLDSIWTSSGLHALDGTSCQPHI